jgi:hypothetical protein
MTNNRDLLKEAIADAKAVKETAIANAKAALEEAFTPQIKSMLSQRLSEMDEMDEMDEMEEMDEYTTPAPSKKNKKYVEPVSETEETDEMDEIYEADEADEMNEMDEMDEMDEIYETDEADEADEADEIDLEELLAELEEEDEMVNEAEEEETEEEGGEEETEEELNIEDMGEEDLKSFIEDVIKDMVSAGELAPGESEGESSEEESKPIDEYSLEELLAEIKKISKKKEIEEGFFKKAGELFGGAPQKAINDFKDKYKADFTALTAAEKNVKQDPQALKDLQDKLLKALDAWSKDAGKKFNVDPADFRNVVEKELTDKITNIDPDDVRSLIQKVASGSKGAVGSGMSQGTFQEEKELKKELKEAYSVINTLKNELNEVNVLNAKLLYTNKIFKDRSLNETQKVKILTAFDKANSVKEAKLVYETLLENLKTTKSSVNESLGFASKAMGTSPKTPIVESNMMVDRFKKLAGII